MSNIADYVGKNVKKSDRILKGICLAITEGDIHNADDLYQDTVVRILNSKINPDIYQGVFVGLFSYNARLEYSEMVRKKFGRGKYVSNGLKYIKNFRHHYSLDDFDFDFTEVFDIDRVDRVDEAERLLSLLSEKERRIIELHYLQGKTKLQIGLELELSESRIYKIFNNAMKKLRERNKGSEVTFDDFETGMKTIYMPSNFFIDGA
jgi:RNA polymerase sigma factor (sigma-70 family)